jgi:endonuclease I
VRLVARLNLRGETKSLTLTLVPLRCVLPTLFFIASALAAPPVGYYDSATGKKGLQLRQALHQIIRGHTVIPYSSSSFDTSDALRVLDEDPVNTNNVFLIYVQRSQAKDTFGANTGWNREHLWPNSYGLDDRHPAYSDLFNLRAEDLTVNAERANKYYDLSATNDASYRFPAHAEATLCSSDFDSWSPPDNVKGDIARSMFYMDVRYEGGIAAEPQLIVTEGVYRINSTTNFMGRLSTLLLWHELDPVDASERLRNDRIFTLYQHNRNPFVDQPQWVREVFWPALQIFYLQPPTNEVALLWSLDFTNSTLQTSAGLHGNWFDVPFGEFDFPGRVVLPASEPRRFYRLRLW